MATDRNDKVTKDLILSDGDKLVVVHALEVYKQTLVRARAKEIPGSLMFSARSDQITDTGRIIEVFK